MTYHVMSHDPTPKPNHERKQVQSTSNVSFKIMLKEGMLVHIFLTCNLEGLKIKMPKTLTLAKGMLNENGVLK
jgi:hypothetical protein